MHLLNKTLVVLVSLLSLAVLPLQALAALEVEISEGTTGKVPIAVVPFAGSAGMPVDLVEIINSDLGGSGFFDTLPRNQMAEKPSSSTEVNYKTWQALKRDNLVVGKVTPLGSGYQVTFEILDTYTSKVLESFTIQAQSAARLRATAHRIADVIFEKLTGLKGIFLTRIAYVKSQGTGWNMKYELLVADQDGYNPIPVVTSEDTVMSPTWSPDGRRLAYVAFNNGKAHVYVLDLTTGKARSLTARSGINGAPAWSPDGQKLAVTLSFTGNPDVYVLDVATAQIKQMTNSRAIETEPSWSPDGKKLMFTSDRGGAAQLYEMSVNGGNAKRITFEGSSNQRGTYSPDGSKIAMVRSDRGVYRVAVMDRATGSVTILSEGRLDESPSFAPNGQVIIYTRSDGRRTELATVSVDGRIKRRLREKGDVREPAWSPKIP